MPMPDADTGRALVWRLEAKYMGVIDDGEDLCVSSGHPVTQFRALKKSAQRSIGNIFKFQKKKKLGLFEC